MVTMQIDKICRACLSEDDKMINMFEKNVYQKFLLFINLTVEEILDIPLNLCQSCEKKLNISMGFKEECQKSHEILLNYIKNTCEVKFEKTDADTHKVDLDATTDANKPLGLQQISQQECEKSHEILLNYTKNTHEAEFAATESDTHKVDLEATTDANKPSGLQQISQQECQKSHEILLNYIKNTHEVKFEPTGADTHQVDSETTGDANKPLRLQQISHNQVWETIKDLKQSICKNKNINCIQCSYVGNSLRSITQHVSHVHKNLKQRWCRVCNAEFDNLAHHVATNHSNDYPCKFCSSKFSSVTRLIAHLRNHSDVKPFSCSFCKMGCTTQNHLNEHLITHSKTKPFQCGLCKKSFTRSCELKKHLEVHKSKGDADEQLAASKLIKQMHISKGPIKCTYCDKEFASPSRLTIHERIHTGDKPHICQVCGKSFSQVGTLKNHMMVHNIGNKKSCDICNKKFNSHTQLSVHLRTHTGEKPFVCTECGKAFRGSHHLSMHNIIHSSLRPYQCNNCGKSFKQKFHLKHHMLAHSGEKPYKCNQCSFACTLGYRLTQHMKKHKVDKPREDRPHVCLICNRTFTTDALLTYHINTHTVGFLEI